MYFVKRLQRLGLAICLLTLASPLAAERRLCANPLFVAVGTDTDTLARVCRIASDTLTYFEACGVPLNRSIEIELIEAFEGPMKHCVGLYRCGQDKIEVLTPDALSEKRDRAGAFVEISDQAYWESIIVHELTHAAYDVVACPFLSCVATSEYASYVMQVRSLPYEERRLFGQTIQLRGVPTDDAISPIMLFMAPDYFATLAWQHFQNRDDPCAYMTYIMQGDLFFDRDLP